MKSSFFRDKALINHPYRTKRWKNTEKKPQNVMETDVKKKGKLMNFKKMEKEIHISYILKQLRVVKNIVRKRLTRDEWRRDFAKYSLISYISSSEEDPGSGSENNDKEEKISATQKDQGEELKRKNEDLSVSPSIFGSSAKNEPKHRQ